MFEDFSFLSSSSTISAHPPCNSPYLDPLDCISPLSHSPLSTRRRCDGRFHTSRTSSIESLGGTSRRLSIDTLTSQFDSHAPFDSPRDELIPRSTPLEEDEGFYEPQYNQTDYFPSMDMINSFDYSLASSSGPSSKSHLTISARRHQRQLLTRLQCLSTTGGLDAHLAVLLEECHPSSLPLLSPDSTTSKGAWKQSVTSAGAAAGSSLSATACSRRNRAIVKKEPRLRKRKDQTS